MVNYWHSQLLPPRYDSCSYQSWSPHVTILTLNEVPCSKLVPCNPHYLISAMCSGNVIENQHNFPLLRCLHWKIGLQIFHIKHPKPDPSCSPGFHSCARFMVSMMALKLTMLGSKCHCFTWRRAERGSRCGTFLRAMQVGLWTNKFQHHLTSKFTNQKHRFRMWNPEGASICKLYIPCFYIMSYINVYHPVSSKAAHLSIRF